MVFLKTDNVKKCQRSNYLIDKCSFKLGQIKSASLSQLNNPIFPMQLFFSLFKGNFCEYKVVSFFLLP